MKNDISKHLKPLGRSKYFFEVTSPIIVFKKVYHPDGKPYYGGYRRTHLIAALELPVGAHVFIERKSCWYDSDGKFVPVQETLQQAVTHQKMRASKAKVISIRAVGNPHEVYAKANSGYSNEFQYIVGQTVRPRRGFSRRREQCAGGIHVLRTFTQARAY